VKQIDEIELNLRRFNAMGLTVHKIVLPAEICKTLVDEVVFDDDTIEIHSMQDYKFLVDINAEVVQYMVTLDS